MSVKGGHRPSSTFVNLGHCADLRASSVARGAAIPCLSRFRTSAPPRWRRPRRRDSLSLAIPCSGRLRGRGGVAAAAGGARSNRFHWDISRGGDRFRAGARRDRPSRPPRLARRSAGGGARDCHHRPLSRPREFHLFVTLGRRREREARDCEGEAEHIFYLRVCGCFFAAAARPSSAGARKSSEDFLREQRQTGQSRLPSKASRGRTLQHAKVVYCLCSTRMTMPQKNNSKLLSLDRGERREGRLIPHLYLF